MGWGGRFWEGIGILGGGGFLGNELPEALREGVELLEREVARAFCHEGLVFWRGAVGGDFFLGEVRAGL